MYMARTGDIDGVADVIAVEKQGGFIGVVFMLEQEFNAG